MSSKPPSSTTAGTGHAARPGGADSSPITTQDWEDWDNAGRPEGPAPAARRGGLPRPTGRAASPNWRRVTTLVTGSAAVLAVFSAGVLYGDLRGAQGTAAATAPSLAPPARASAPPPPTATVVVQAPSNVPVVTQPVGVLRGSPPIGVDIPALKINQRLIGLRVRANRQLEVPKDYGDIGWWSTGPVAGDPGAAVIVGHVDSAAGPAVFYRLSSLTKGATVAVRRADGTTARFRVTKVQSFAKDRFPDKLVYRTTGKRSLHLVTCGGSYDSSTGYRENVVVFADLIGPRPATKPKHDGARTKKAAKRPPASPKNKKATAKSERSNKPERQSKKKEIRDK